jgi:mRNA-degrading endonuclease RelE of RelBE toxin-antitoxin system
MVSEKLQELSVNPHPGGNIERLCIRGRMEYHGMHVSRSFTIFYTIHEEEKSVHILEILTIEQAHKKYGTLLHDYREM